MKIVILTQFFPPEVGAAQNRLYDLACRLSARGHSVKVLTSLPSYPEGAIYGSYKGHLVKTEDHKGISIVRIWLYATKKRTFVPRILNYLSFSMLAFFVGLFALGHADVIFVESPPLFVGVSGYLLSKLKRIELVLNISDLWPESAVALGVLKNRRVIRWATRIEEGLYRSARMVTGQTEGIVSSIRQRCPTTTVALCTNGVAPEFIARTRECHELRESTRANLGVQGKFVVGYAGLHGLVYGLDDVLDVSRVLARLPDIVFLLIGDGPEKARLQARAISEQMDNVLFYPSQPASRMPEILTAMDISLITLKRHKLFRGTLPSKLFEAIGAGIPVVAAVEGEAKSLVEASSGGLVVEPENTSEMAEAILRLYRDPGLRRRISADGRDYVAAHYNREVIAGRFESLLLTIVSNGLVGSQERMPNGGEGPEASPLELVDEKHPRAGD
jgi:glycosyltransferase involved in cell wall biosynthesis